MWGGGGSESVDPIAVGPQDGWGCTSLASAPILLHSLCILGLYVLELKKYGMFSSWQTFLRQPEFSEVFTYYSTQSTL